MMGCRVAAGIAFVNVALSFWPTSYWTDSIFAAIGWGLAGFALIALSTRPRP